jgi:hypothetical protein
VGEPLGVITHKLDHALHKIHLELSVLFKKGWIFPVKLLCDKARKVEFLIHLEVDALEALKTMDLALEPPQIRQRDSQGLDLFKDGKAECPSELDSHGHSEVRGDNNKCVLIGVDFEGQLLSPILVYEILTLYILDKSSVLLKRL